MKSLEAESFLRKPNMEINCHNERHSLSSATSTSTFFIRPTAAFLPFSFIKDLYAKEKFKRKPIAGTGTVELGLARSSNVSHTWQV